MAKQARIICELSRTNAALAESEFAAAAGAIDQSSRRSGSVSNGSDVDLRRGQRWARTSAPHLSPSLCLSTSVLASSVLLRPAPSCGCPRAAASDLLLVRQTAPAGGGAKTAGPLVQLQAKWGALDDKQQNIVLVVA